MLWFTFISIFSQSLILFNFLLLNETTVFTFLYQSTFLCNWFWKWWPSLSIWHIWSFLLTAKSISFILACLLSKNCCRRADHLRYLSSIKNTIKVLKSKNQPKIVLHSSSVPSACSFFRNNRSFLWLVYLDVQVAWKGLLSWPLYNGVYPYFYS